MNRLKLSVIFAAGAALALSPAHVAAQAAANPISMGMKLAHVTEDGIDAGQVTEMLPDRTGAALGFRVGDILIEAGGKPISPEILKEYMGAKKVGDQLSFKVKRSGEVVELTGKALAAPEGAVPPAEQPQL